MKDDLFRELMESAGEALEHAKGRLTLRTTVLPAPPKPMSARDVRRLRTKLKASQSVFASWLNVSTKLVQAWESDRRSPGGPALRLLRLAEQEPDLIFPRKPAISKNVSARKRPAYRKAAAKKVHRSKSA